MGAYQVAVELDILQGDSSSDHVRPQAVLGQVEHILANNVLDDVDDGLLRHDGGWWCPNGRYSVRGSNLATAESEEVETRACG